MPAENRRDAHADRRRLSRGGRRAGDQPGRCPTLLVADGYDGARVPCAQYLDHFGFSVQQAADSRDAMQAIRSAPPDVMLVELSLAERDGLSLCEWLKQDSRAQTTPLIVMLSDFQSHGVRAFPEHVAGVLVKPFPLAVMLEEVRRALRCQAAPTTN